MILLLSLCAYAKNPKASKSTTEAESGNASPTKAREKPSILYTHTCGSGVATYSLDAPLGSSSKFKNLVSLMCDAYDLFISNYAPIYKEIRIKTRKCEDATANKNSKSIDKAIASLKKDMKSNDYKTREAYSKRDSRFELQRLKEKKKEAAINYEKFCSEYKEFKKTVKVSLKEFKKEGKVILERANRYLQACMNDVGNCREERFSMEKLMEEMRANAKKEEGYDAASEQGATQEQSNSNANPEEKPRINDGRFKRFMAKLHKGV
ncbi:hypothetical protein BSLG_003204 [Batrachochytrium salamandrivorans]|nr:hypothetical protein BSLG_003204 [Batrachochytrium salamandrivorans]